MIMWSMTFTNIHFLKIKSWKYLFLTVHICLIMLPSFTGLRLLIKNKLQITLNKFMRVIVRFHLYAHSVSWVDTFEKLNWTTVEKKNHVLYIRILFTYKIVKDNVPKYMMKTLQGSCTTSGSSIVYIPCHVKV